MHTPLLNDDYSVTLHVCYGQIDLTQTAEEFRAIEEAYEYAYEWVFGSGEPPPEPTYTKKEGKQPTKRPRRT